MTNHGTATAPVEFEQPGVDPVYLTRDDLARTLQPANSYECMLVTVMAQSWHELQHARELEAQIFAQTRPLDLFSTRLEHFKAITRYIDTADRKWRMATTAFEHAKRNRPPRPILRPQTTPPGPGLRNEPNPTPATRPGTPPHYETNPTPPRSPEPGGNPAPALRNEPNRAPATPPRTQPSHSAALPNQAKASPARRRGQTEPNPAPAAHAVTQPHHETNPTPPRPTEPGSNPAPSTQPAHPTGSPNEPNPVPAPQAGQNGPNRVPRTKPGRPTALRN